MYEVRVVYRNIRRADSAVATRLGAFGAATVHEAMGRMGLMKPYLRPVYAGAQASGTAVTVRLAEGVLGLDMYSMREPLQQAGLRYID